MNKISCLLGFHKLRPVDFEDMNYKDERHGYIEQDYCVNCDYKTEIRTFY